MDGKTQDYTHTHKHAELAKSAIDLALGLLKLLPTPIAADSMVYDSLEAIRRVPLESRNTTDVGVQVYFIHRGLESQANQSTRKHSVSSPDVIMQQMQENHKLNIIRDDPSIPAVSLQEVNELEKEMLKNTITMRVWLLRLELELAYSNRAENDLDMFDDTKLPRFFEHMKDVGLELEKTIASFDAENFDDANIYVAKAEELFLELCPERLRKKRVSKAGGPTNIEKNQPLVRYNLAVVWEDVQKCLQIASKYMMEHNYDKAKRMAEKAEWIHPTPAARALLEQIRIVTIKAKEEAAELAKERAIKEAELDKERAIKEAELDKERAIKEAVELAKEKWIKAAELDKERAIKEAELDKERAIKEAELDKERAIKEAELDKERAIKEAVELAKEKWIKAAELDKERAIKEAELDKERAIKEAELDKERAIKEAELDKERAIKEAVELAKEKWIKAAELDKERAIKEAELDKERAIKEAELDKERAIKEAELDKERAIKEAELDKERAIKEAVELAKEKWIKAAELDKERAIKEAELDKERAIKEAELDKERAIKEAVELAKEKWIKAAELDKERAIKEAELDKERAIKEAELDKERAIKEAELDKERAIKEAVELAKEKWIKAAELDKERAIKEAELDKERAIKEAELDKERAIKEAELDKERAIKEAELDKERAIKEAELDKGIEITGVQMEGLEVCEATFRFTVPNFRNMIDRTLSPPCYIRGLPWRILVMQKISEGRQQKYLGFFLQCNAESASTSWSCFAKAQLRLISHIPDEEPIFKDIKLIFNSKEKDWGFLYFMLWDDVINPSKGFIKDNAVTLEVHVAADPPRGVSQDK